MVMQLASVNQGYQADLWRLRLRASKTEMRVVDCGLLQATLLKSAQLFAFFLTPN